MSEKCTVLKKPIEFGSENAKQYICKIKFRIMDKPVIYQILPRLWGNDIESPVRRGSIEDNGSGKLSQIDGPALEYFRWLGCTHIWYTGIIRHSTKSASMGCEPSNPQFVKGEAGSPYAICDYYDVNPYLADDPERRMEEFEALVKRTHDAGLKVIIDFVPNHVSRDYGMQRKEHRPGDIGCDDDKSVHWSQDNDFFYYPGQPLVLPNRQAFTEECRSLENGDFTREYEIVPAWIVEQCRDKFTESPSEYQSFLSGFRQLLTPFQEMPAKVTGNSYTPAPGVNDWYETVKINYCDTRTATWDKMLSVLKFWADKGVDGFRCDMVELVPAQFMQWLISEMKALYPEIIFIAEVYKKDLYRKYIREVGFDYLYDKSGLYDTLRTIVEANVNSYGMPIELWQSARGITRNWQSLGDIQPYMLNFLENHDEQRFPSDFFGKKPENEMAPLAVSLYLNRAPFMIYMGEEMGESGMDNEGFSGTDGRTTIFDWWSVPSLRVLRKIIREKLYLAENAWPGDLAAYEPFFRRFSSMVRFAAGDDAVRKGMTYDLCYCNTNSEGFDIDRHFAFLRDHEDETLLVVANFSDRESDIRLRIPEHAFEWLELAPTEKVNPDTPIEVKVPPMDAVVLLIS